MVSPALKGPAGLAVLVTDTLEQLTTTSVAPVPVGGSESAEPSLATSTWARLETVPQVWVSVPVWMWTLKLPVVAARSPTLQVKTLGVTVLSMEHAALVGLTDQSMPLPVGRLSVRTTPWATPAPVL